MLKSEQDNADKIAELKERFASAKIQRQQWQGHWQDCYDYTLPQRGQMGFARQGQRLSEKLFDATAADASEQLAASLLANLTPPWSQWMGFKAGAQLPESELDNIAPALQRMAIRFQEAFDRSNFAVEMHQCFLDLVIAGTACLLFEEAPVGQSTAFQFRAVPLSQLYFLEDNQGRLTTTFRQHVLSAQDIVNRFGEAVLSNTDFAKQYKKNIHAQIRIIEAVCPVKNQHQQKFSYDVFLEEGGERTALLCHEKIAHSPYISFRWMKSPGEIYGRSPVMKALPDIKTANKVVELILKNASIAVTGIWQADDDGVMNPANIRLQPGAIIPKAVGSAGLKPLQMPGNFDVSQLVLGDLRQRIRHALLVDKLAQINDRRMTATEVLTRSAEMAQLLGASYGRLQSELLMPLAQRAYGILRRRGLMPDMSVDGRLLAWDDRSPLARAQAQRDVETTLQWLQGAAIYGPDALQSIDIPAAVRWVGQRLGVPAELMRYPETALNEMFSTQADVYSPHHQPIPNNHQKET